MKNYLIIGASSGIGKAITAQLSEHHRVYGTYHKNVVNESNENVSYHHLDVLDDFDLQSFLPESLDGLVYCPGAIVLKPLARIKEEEMLNDFRLQVSGAVKVIQACLPNLKMAESPSIVLFSSVAATLGFNFHGVVSASKGAVEGLTKAMAAELAPRIRVNCIAPSITQTPLAATLLNTPEKIEANAQRHPLRRIGSAEDIAKAAVFLLGDESSWISGQVMPVDGGMSSLKV